MCEIKPSIGSIDFFILGIYVSVGLGQLLIGRLVEYLRSQNPKVPHTTGTYNWLIGMTERLVYTVVFLMGKDYVGFILLWFGLKGIGRWGKEHYAIYSIDTAQGACMTKHELDAANTKVVNLYLLGNLFSIVFAFFGAIIIKYLGGANLSCLF